MLKTLLLTAALVAPVAAYADDAPMPCAFTPSSAFNDLFPSSSGIEVLAVGEVVKENGRNVCSVLIDTSAGRANLVFTTTLLLNGNTAWKRIAIKRVY